jgi:hypothetical protein
MLKFKIPKCLKLQELKQNLSPLTFLYGRAAGFSNSELFGTGWAERSMDSNEFWNDEYWEIG